MMQGKGLFGGDSFTGQTPVPQEGFTGETPVPQGTGPQGPPFIGDPEALRAAWAEYYEWMWEVSGPHSGPHVL